jgi:hypothetical protein
VNVVMPVDVVRRNAERRFEEIELPLELGGDGHYGDGIRIAQFRDPRPAPELLAARPLSVTPAPSTSWRPLFRSRKAVKGAPSARRRPAGSAP